VASLTRDEARERAGLIGVEGYHLVLELAAGDQHFGSVTTIRFTATPRASTFVDVAPHELHSVTLNGQSVDLDDAFDPAARRLRLADLEDANELVVDATMAYSHDGEGLHRHVDPADNLPYLYAMSFLAAAPRWYACFDQPDLKAPVEVEVSCPDDWVVFGNGPATQTAPGRWTVASTGPLATYFTTLVAGPYHVLRDEHDGIPLSLSVRQSLAEHLDRDAPALFAHTKHCLDELHELFGVRYPWGEYHQAFVPEFNAGAMENPGCVTFRDTLVFRSRVTDNERLVRDITIAHEMAHMWFGDLVTMRWWDDLWLNESFAEYLGSRVTGERSWVDFGIHRKSWGFAADRRPSTHPVAGNGAADAASALSEFDGISYAKGASVLRQLALHLGDEMFFDGLRRYIRAHAEGNAEFAQLMAAWAQAGAVDLDSWAAEWLRTTGLDELSVDGGSLHRTSSDGTTRMHAIAVAGFTRHGAEVAATRTTIESDQTPVEVVGDILVADALDETWAKVALPTTAWEQMPTALPWIGEARTRVAIWNAMQLAVADAELDPSLAFEIVAAGLPIETDDGVIDGVGRWATRTLAGCYVSDHARLAVLARLSGAALGLADVAEPKSARQLAAVRVAIGAAIDPDRLLRWLDEQDLPAGVLVDAELRWAIVGRLATLGAIGRGFIDAEAQADLSSQGIVHATRCRASLPDPAAKEAAWTALMTDDERANYELYALAEGFWHPHQSALTEPYVARYFDEIDGTAKLRSGWVVERLAAMTYPWPAIDDATVEQTDELLAGDGLDGRIRRAVTDAGDDLRRAVAARRRFPG
jgi:aminopeptidase N